MTLDALQAADRQAARIEALGRSRVAYAAPEQLLGQTADHRADLFALGALLHEMVTGKHAFSGRTPLDIGVQVLQSRPPAPSALNPEVPRSHRPHHREGPGQEARRSLSGRGADGGRPSRRGGRGAQPGGRHRARRAPGRDRRGARGRARPAAARRRRARALALAGAAAPGLGRDSSASRPSRCSSSCRSTSPPPTPRGPTTARGSPRTWPAGSHRCAGSPSSADRRSARPRASRPRPWPRRWARDWR